MQTVEYPNWFAITGQEPFERHLLQLAGQPGLRFLQVGVFTGDATVWLLDNVLTGERSSLIDVDTWEGSKELAHEQFDWADVERVYDERTDRAQVGPLFKFKCTSADFFAGESGEFDFIYVDAAHDTDAAYTDALAAFQVLKVGGLLAFDDFNWGTVAHAVKTFASRYEKQLETLELGAQAWFRRIA